LNRRRTSLHWPHALPLSSVSRPPPPCHGARTPASRTPHALAADGRHGHAAASRPPRPASPPRRASGQATGRAQRPSSQAPTTPKHAPTRTQAATPLPRARSRPSRPAHRAQGRRQLRRARRQAPALLHRPPRWIRHRRPLAWARCRRVEPSRGSVDPTTARPSPAGAVFLMARRSSPSARAPSPTLPRSPLQLLLVRLPLLRQVAREHKPQDASEFIQLARRRR
jgi:hypothetical protein